MSSREDKPEDLERSWEQQPRVAIQAPLDQTPFSPEEIQEEKLEKVNIVILEL